MIVEQQHWIATPQGRLYAKTWNLAVCADSPPILMFHDSLGCVALWREFPRLLSINLGRGVIAYDRLGFGRSDPCEEAMSPDFIAAEAENVLPFLFEQLSISNFLACGHSVGGGMAVEAAARFPDRCDAVVTIAAQAFVEEKTLQGIRSAQEAFRSAENVARLGKYHGSKAQWVLKSWIDTWLSPQFASWSLEPALARLCCPVAAIHGENDEYGSTAQPMRIAGEYGTVRILPGIGHTPHRECPELLVRTVTEVIREMA